MFFGGKIEFANPYLLTQRRYYEGRFRADHHRILLQFLRLHRRGPGRFHEIAISLRH
jgi:hypothetical protein